MHIRARLVDPTNIALIILCNYQHPCPLPCVATLADYVLLLFIYFLFNVRSQKLFNRFSPNFQELCILV